VAQSGIPTIASPRTDFRSAGEQIRGREDEVTLKELYSILTGDKRNHDFIGTAEHVAGSLERWHADGAADGFNLMFSLLPHDLVRFTSEVVPLLQERGLARAEYAGSTLKSHLGLSPEAAASPDGGITDDGSHHDQHSNSGQIPDPAGDRGRIRGSRQAHL
jgi:hypothetical protein